MALFGSKAKQNTDVSTKVRPTVVRTQNVPKEILKVAKTYNVKPDTLDFNLLEIQSYTRMNSKEKEGEWESVENEALHSVDESYLLNKYFELKQTYEIEIFSKGTQTEDSCQNLMCAVGANATKCKVYLSIKEGSFVEYSPRFSVEFEEMIRKKKVRAGILVYIFDEMVDDFISRISANLKVNGTLHYEKNETHLIAQGYEPTPTRDDALLLHYKKNEKKLDEHKRIDYAQRGFIHSVKEGEVFIEYIKAKEGKAGRNCRGSFLQPAEARVKNEPTFAVDETIKVEETPDAIKYIAKENGYIAFENNTYSIKKELDVDQISFKKTGSIRSGIDSDVNMCVTEADAIKDAVGTGMYVEVSEIDIDGNVGSNAKVIAKKAVIGGQTHKTAYIEANDLNINVHKGIAQGDNIHITRLEHGKVQGEYVSIAQALGGVIKGKEIDIEVCTSHVKAIAAKKIEIKKLQGSENTFTIDPLLQDEVLEGLEDNEQKIEKLKEQLKVLKLDVETTTASIKEGMPSFLELKKRLMRYQKNGVKMPATFVKKYKVFQNMQEHLKKIKSEYKAKNNELTLLVSATASFQENIMDARIINRDRWVGYNVIKFKLIDPPVELVYKPKEGSQDKVFGLVEVDEGEYMIAPVVE